MLEECPVGIFQGATDHKGECTLLSSKTPSRHWRIVKQSGALLPANLRCYQGRGRSIDCGAVNQNLVLKIPNKYTVLLVEKYSTDMGAFRNNGDENILLKRISCQCIGNEESSAVDAHTT